MPARKNRVAQSVDLALAALETPSGQTRVKEQLRGLATTAGGDRELELETLVEAFKELRRRSLL
jgi:hypothetical protein